MVSIFSPENTKDFSHDINWFKLVHIMTISLLAWRKLVPPLGAGMRMTELSQGIGDAQASAWLLCDSPGAANCCSHGLPASPAQHHLSLGICLSVQLLWHLCCRKGGHPPQRGEGSSKWGAEVSSYQEAATPKVSTLRQASGTRPHAIYFLK